MDKDTFISMQHVFWYSFLIILLDNSSPHSMNIKLQTLAYIKAIQSCKKIYYLKKLPLFSSIYGIQPCCILSSFKF